MALNKLTYVDNVTVIPASNLNAIQDEVIANGTNVASAKSEVEDIRVGADGTTYASAGDAVRGQVQGIQDDLQLKAWDIGSYNRLDTTKVINGIITKTGTIISDSYWQISDYIPVNPSEVIYADGNNASYFALYDIDKNVVTNDTNWSNPFTVPADVYYIRFTFDSAILYRSYVSTQNEYDAYSKLVPYVHDKINAVSDDYEQLTEYDDQTNLIDPNNTVANRYVDGTDGTLKTANGFYATDYVPMDENTQYYFNSEYLYRGYAAFYDSNKNYISGYGVASASVYMPTPFTTPSGTAYGRFTVTSQANLANAWLCKTNQMAMKPADYADKVKIKFTDEKPTDYKGDDVAIFTKILCIGDSLTDGFFNESGGSRLIMRNRSYPAKLQALTGIECTNMGYAGYTSAQWYSEYADTDLSGHDACIIQLGVNDALTNVSEADMDTALTSIINKVKAENAGIKIFVATIIPANGYMTVAMRTRSQMIRDFVSNLNDDNVYLVDLWAYGHTDDLLAFDAGHLSAYGYLQLAMDYKAYISYIIRNNPNDFRYVQFVGTSYSYTGDEQVRPITY